MNQSKQIEIAMCWFDEEQWKLLKILDPQGTDGTYEEWRKQANEALSELRSAGQKIVKVSVKIDELLDWCKKNDRDPVSSSRSEYAAFKLRQKNKAIKT